MAAACRLCGSEKTSSVSTRDRLGRRVRTHLCEDCGLVFNTPILPDRALMQIHVEDCRHARGPGRAPPLAHTVRVLLRLERTLTEYWPLIGDKRRVLDAGAAHGEFSFVMTALGFEVEALDPDADAAAFCQAVLDAPVRVANFVEEDYPPGAFDLIRIHHILAHCADPVAVLEKLRGWLSADGLLYVESPNVEAQANFRGRGEVFDAGHAVCFNPQTLRAALAKAGFAEVEATARRHAGTTAGFFEKAEPKGVERDPANARRVSDAITRNYSGAKQVRKKLSQLVDDLAGKAADLRLTRGLSEHRQAAEHFAERLKRRLVP